MEKKPNLHLVHSSQNIEAHNTTDDIEINKNDLTVDEFIESELANYADLLEEARQRAPEAYRRLDEMFLSTLRKYLINQEQGLDGVKVDRVSASGSIARAMDVLRQGLYGKLEAVDGGAEVIDISDYEKSRSNHPAGRTLQALSKAGVSPIIAVDFKNKERLDY